MRVHEIKCREPYFREVRCGRKTFEVRKNDRGYQDGDVLILRAWDVDAGFLPADPVVCRVTYMLNGGQFGIEQGNCILGIKVLA